MKNIIFRADGNSQIGLGHIYRSLALAELLNKEFNCVFICATVNDDLKKLILSFCSKIIDIKTDNNYEKEISYWSSFISTEDIIVLDGYKFNTEYQRILKIKGFFIVSIDDLCKYYFYSDIVINHSPHIKTTDYSSERYTKFYLGTDYALIRKSFIQSARNKQLINTIDKLLICFGGADPENFTLKTLESALKSNIKEVNIVLGSSYIHSIEHIHNIKNLQNIKIIIHRNLDEIEMNILMQKCHLAVLPASTITFEALSNGMKIICGYYVNNQEKFACYLGNNKIAVNVGDYNNFNFEGLVNMINCFIENPNFIRTNNFIDGNQDKRLVEIFKSIDND